MTQVDFDGTMRNAEATTWVTCRAPVGAVTVPVAPAVSWHEESSGNSCLSSPPGTSPLRCVARCTRPEFFWLCSAVRKLGYRTPLISSGSTAMTMPWLAGSGTQRPRWNTFSFTTPETWRWGYCSSPSQSVAQMVWTCTECPVLYQIYHRHSDSRHQRARKD